MHISHSFRTFSAEVMFKLQTVKLIPLTPSTATAGAVSVFVNNPLDVVKTRMQGLEASNYKGSWDCFKQILLKSPLSFYRGVTPRLIRVCGDAAVTFTAYGYYVR